jgi:hypothetical protein
MGRFFQKRSIKYFENHIFSMQKKPLDIPIITLINIEYLKIHLDKRTSCMTLFSKIKIAGDRIDEISWSKDQKLSTLNFPTFGTTNKKLQSRFPGPNRLFWRICLQNLVFEISCVGEDLARFQKPLFWTPDITPHPSPALVIHVIFVEPKTASREPCGRSSRGFIG